jgi:hypothetical protein
LLSSNKKKKRKKGEKNIKRVTKGRVFFLFSKKRFLLLIKIKIKKQKGSYFNA